MTAPALALVVDEESAGKRLDAFLAEQAQGLTRSQAERLAKEGRVTVNGRPAAAGHRLASGDVVSASLPPAAVEGIEPESVELDILFEDDQLIVVNKPQGMAVYPGPNRPAGTLANALRAHTPALAAAAGSHRPGIVHRLDRNTSGLLVVAKTDQAYRDLSQQLRRREVERRYLALVWGDLRQDRLVIGVPIGRHSRDHTRMAAVTQPVEGQRPRAAHTDVSAVERFGSMTLTEARLHTGRTHQIRVHLAHVGHPVVGDPTYGLRQAKRRQAALEPATLALVAALPGQALHAHLLRFRHPTGRQHLTFTAPMPADMGRMVTHLRTLRRAGGAKLKKVWLEPSP